MTYEAWQYEYLYWSRPEIDPSGKNHEAIMRELGKTDFTSAEAAAFRAGFDSCRDLAQKAAEDLVGTIRAANF